MKILARLACYPEVDSYPALKSNQKSHMENDVPKLERGPADPGIRTGCHTFVERVAGNLRKANSREAICVFARVTVCSRGMVKPLNGFFKLVGRFVHKIFFHAMKIFLSILFELVILPISVILETFGATR